MPGKRGELFERLGSVFPALATEAEIFVGVQTSADSVFHLTPEGSNRYWSAFLNSSVAIESDNLRPLLSGSDVGSYRTKSRPAKVIPFPYEVEGEEATLLSWQKLSSLYPRAARYLLANERTLRCRASSRFDDALWYRFGRSQNLGKQGRSKLCVPRLVSRLGLAADLLGECALDNVDVCGLSIRESVSRTMDLRYFLGTINSRLSAWLFPRVSAPFRGGFMSANRQFLGQLPFHPIDFTNKQDTAHHDRMVALVEQMLAAKQQEAAAGGQAKEIAARKCAALDRQIDALVYELYGLSAEEIALVEGAA